MKIYVVGDSISIHYGPYLKQYLTGVMDYSRKGGEAAASSPVDSPDANGGPSNAVLEFLSESSKSGGVNGDVVLVNCGLHDIKSDLKTGERLIPLEAYENNLRSIVAVVRGMRKEMIWVRITPSDDSVHNRPGAMFHRYAADLAAYQAVADRVMNEAGVPVIDLFTFTVNLNVGPDLYCDHIHFNEHVREKQGAFIAGWLTAWRNGKDQG